MMDRRELIGGGPLIGASLISPTRSAETSQHAPIDSPPKAQSLQMHDYLMTARFRDHVIREVGKVSMAARQDALDTLAKELKSRLTNFYLFGGTWRVLALFNLSSEASSRLVHRLRASGLFDSDFRLGRVLTSVEVDHALASARKGVQPWSVPEVETRQP